MRRTLYLECYSGISGDMAVAALLDLGADQTALKEAIDSVSLLVGGFEVEITRVQKAGIDACDFNVVLDREHDAHDHDMEYLYGHEHHQEDHHGHCHDGQKQHHHEHHHEHRGMTEITEILNKAKMTDGARKLSLRIFEILAQAEARAHNRPVEEVHFHEVGAVDSIIDIMSVGVCIDSLKSRYGIDDFVVSTLYEGQGSVRCQHGVLPVPVPAVANIIQAYGLPVHIMEAQGEFVTPTGAAIVAAVRTTADLPEHFRVVGSGIGAGKRTQEPQGLLRAMLLEDETVKEDHICKLETNIDDCAGEALGYVMERLFEAGARDVNYMPVFMKKNRPAYQLNVLCDLKDIQKLEQIIFRETSTIGIRRVEMERTVLEREKRKADTSMGNIEVKSCGDRVYPEYESLAAICREKNVPYVEAYNRVFAELNKQIIGGRQDD